LFVLDALWPHLNALEGSFCLALFLDIKIYLCGYRGFGKKFNERIAAAIIGEWKNWSRVNRTCAATRNCPQ